MSETRLTGRRPQQIARTLQLDQAAIQLLPTLSSQNIPALLLKGASFWEWLYPTEGRSYEDVDILVSRALWDLAVQVIERLGFTRRRLGRVGGDW